MKTVKWMMHLLAPYKWRVLAGSFLVALTVLGNAGLLATSGLLLSKAAITSEVLLLMPLIPGVRFFGFGRAVIRYAERLLNHSIAFRILGFLRQDFYAHLEPLVPDSMPNYSKGKLYNQFISDINTLQYFYLKAVSVPVGSFVVFLVSAGFLAHYDVYLVLPLLFGHVVAGILVPLLALLGADDTKEQLEVTKTAITEGFLDYKQGMVDLHLFAKQRQVEEGLSRDLGRLTHLAYKMSTKKRLINRLVFTMSHLTMLMVLMMLVAPVQAGAIQGVEVAMLGLLVLASFEAVMQMPEALLQMDESILAAKSLREVYEKEAFAQSEGTREPQGFALALDKVSFSYHDKNRRFIEGLQLSIEEGEHVAIVGESGSGKSTLGHLLSGLWTVDGGRVLLGGCDVTTIDEARLHKTIATVEQSSYFFYASLRDNMRLANEDASDDAIWQALEMVELADTVRALPEGLDTILAENASALSGGQRQRLALARMIVTEPKIIILDEALQKLDRTLSQRIFERLLEWGKEKTIIMITHSLLSLDVLDKAYVISYGSIIEKGVPKELREKTDGAYRTLYNIERSQF